ncbi:MAG: HAD hydrolase family protein, partial [Pyrinomonadaceae bacterium]
ADPNGKGTLLYDQVSQDNVPLQRYLKWSLTLHGDEAEHAVMQVADLHHELPKHEVIHISFSGQCEPMAKMFAFLKSELKETVTILPTIYPHRDFTLIDILPPGVTKGTGVERLASINNFTAEM